MATQQGHGHLVVIGGAEDRHDAKAILSRFLELAGGPDQDIAVITAASESAHRMWEVYDKTFRDLGATRHEHVHIESREDANNPDLVDKVARAGGIFITGGDQKRLLALIGGTALDTALHQAFEEHGACIAGTSAGASAMSGHMLADGGSASGPPLLGAGLGLIHRAVIDQHFAERQRLTRLLTVVAQNPYLQGIGIDEDTALVIERGAAIEVIGDGAVTILDGRDITSNIADAGDGGTPELFDMRLHLLPAGTRYALGQDDAGNVPPSLLAFMKNVTKRNCAS
ncbi:MAG: cyanophycinase [Telluria sp.]